MSLIHDAEARAAIATDLDTTLVVEAAAGTGKTTALVARIIALVRTGRAELAGIVAVTFADKAAGEMKLRLRADLEHALFAAETTDGERARFRKALEQLETAHITTVHALCGDILRERPIEATVDPRFKVAAGGERSPVYRQAFDVWFRRALTEQPEGVRRFLRRVRRGRGDAGPRARLEAAGWKVVERRDFTRGWRRPDWDRAAAVDELLLQIRTLHYAYTDQSPHDPRDQLRKNLLEIRRVIEEIDAREKLAPGEARDVDGVEAELCSLASSYTWRGAGYGRMFAQGIERATIVAERDAVKAGLDAFAAAAEADLAAVLRDDLRGLVAEYEALKERTGELDFTDLLGRLAIVLRADRDLREKLQRRFSHLFVDEFQDTDPLQADIVLLLAADGPAESDPRKVRLTPGKLFIVGDPKQSIYRFRRADIALYEAVKAQLVAQGARLLQLTTSFRGVRSIQAAVNAAFATRMVGGSQASWVPLTEFRPDPTPEDNAPPPIIALPIPEPYSKKLKVPRVTDEAIERSAPDAVAALVAWLCQDSGWTVVEDGARVPIVSRHVCLLFRRFQSFGTDIAGRYATALEARGLRHVLVGGATFHDRDEVQAVRTALRAIEWPDDELSVYATLRGPLFAVDDATLFAFKELGRLDPAAYGPDRRPPKHDALAPAEQAVFEPILQSLGLLGRLHMRRNHVPIADTLSLLLEGVRAHAGLALAHGGERALANVLRLLDLARDFESDGATSFRAFVRQLEEDAERGVSPEAPAVEEGADGVRLMTAHKAKGLEFPIVVLCDPTAPRSLSRPGLWIDAEAGLWAAPLDRLTPQDLIDHRQDALDRDADEGDRLAYVAATRARDCLIVPICTDDPVGGWYEALHSAIYPPPERRERPDALGFADWAGADTVVGRQGVPRNTLRAGRHRMPEWDVVVWAPSALRLTANTPVGVAHHDALADGAATAQGRDDYVAYLEARDRTLQEGQTETLPAITATALAHGTSDGDDELAALLQDARPVVTATVEGRRVDRPHGRRFGTLVHAVLATVPLESSGDVIAAEATLSGRWLGATSEEAAAAATVVAAVLAHAWLLAGRDGRALREHPVAFWREDRLVEGVVDLLIDRGPDGYRVIDYKTDTYVTPEVQHAYEAQVRVYADAVTAATGRPAEPCLLFV